MVYKQKKPVKKAIRKKRSSAVHVQIFNPVPMQRDIVESAIETLELLKRVQRYKELRNQKHQKILQLRKIVGSIRHYMIRLKLNEDLLQGEEVFESISSRKKEKRIKKPKKPIATKKPTKTKSRTHEDTLHDELASLKAKLAKI